MSIARDALDNHGLIVGVSPERFRAVAMPLLFDHLNAQCEGTIAVNRQARIVWINDKYAEKVGIRDPSSVLGKEIEEVLPASRLREVVESGQPSMLDLMAFGDEHFVVTRIPLRDEDGTLVGALGFVLFDRARHLAADVQVHQPADPAGRHPERTGQGTPGALHHRRFHRQQPGRQRNQASGPARRAARCHGAAARRDRHRQGAAGPGHP